MLLVACISCGHTNEFTRQDLHDAVGELKILFGEWVALEITWATASPKRLAQLESYQDDWFLLYDRWIRDVGVGNIYAERLSLRALIYFTSSVARQESGLASEILTASTAVYDLFRFFGPEAGPWRGCGDRVDCGPTPLM